MIGRLLALYAESAFRRPKDSPHARADSKSMWETMTVPIRDDDALRSLTPARGSSGELERIRTALQAAVDRGSLRSVAGSVGMSPTGLSNVLNGTQPHGKTMVRLREWYQRDEGLNGVPAQVIVDQLRRYVSTLPKPDEGVAILVTTINRLYAAAEMPTPEWVRRVRSSLMA